MSQVQMASAMVKAGLTQEQAVSLVRQGDEQLPMLVAGLKQPALVPTIRERLLAMLPANTVDPLEAELTALLASPLPRGPQKAGKTAKTKPTTSKATSTRTTGKLLRKPTGKAAGAVQRHEWTGQAPLSESTGKTLPWVVSAGVTDNGTYLNVGWKGLRTIGASIEVWREMLTNADELLTDLEEFANDIG